LVKGVAKQVALPVVYGSEVVDAPRPQLQERRTEPDHEEEQLLSQGSHTIEADNDDEFTPDKQQQQQQDDEDDADIDDDADEDLEPARPAKAVKGVRKAACSVFERNKARADMLRAEAAAKAADAECFERKSKAKIEERREMLKLEKEELELRKLKHEHAANAKVDAADALAEKERILGDAKAAAEQHKIEAKQAQRTLLKWQKLLPRRSTATNV
jgi:hypothetical protein